MTKLTDLLTIPEAARLLGFSPEALRVAIHRKLLKVEKRGRDNWVTLRELNRYRAEHMRKGKQK